MSLDHALTQAKIRRGFCSPNPSVGATIVNSEDTIIAESCHVASGYPHAEINALSQLSNISPGSTLYITLEPCCHWGKTPPCTDAIIKSGIKRVIFGYYDPNPLVSGKGQETLRAAGIECEYEPHPDIDAFYESYTHWQKTKTPFLTAKIALSLNGAISDSKGNPVQITGPMINAFTHASRKKTDAILTTFNTIFHDDPKLNVRINQEIIAKPLYILDRDANLPLTASIFKTAKSITLFHSSGAHEKKLQALADMDVRCIPVTCQEQKLSLPEIIQYIGQDGIHDCWIEAGGRLFSECYTLKLLQRAYIYIAPLWISSGKIAFPEGISLLKDKAKIRWESFGNDVLCEIHW